MEEELCQSENCENEVGKRGSELLFVARNIFGSSGKNLVDGYCSFCAGNRLWISWQNFRL